MPSRTRRRSSVAASIVAAVVSICLIAPATEATAASSSSAAGLSTFTRLPTPAIAGRLDVGQTVTADVEASVPAATSYQYAWKINGKDVVNGSGHTYTLTTNDSGKSITVVATAIRAGFASASASSASYRIAGKAVYATSAAPTQPAEAASSGTHPLAAFVHVPTPDVAGTMTVGSTLSATVASFEPAATSLQYGWKINGKDVINGSGQTYTLTSLDAGKSIAVVVSGTRSGYSSASTTSSARRIAGTAVYSTPVAPTAPTPPSTPPAAPAPPASTWMSGASGVGSADDSFGTWRGASQQITGTWSDNDANMVQFWPLQKGGELANWDKPMDVAVGAFDSGESWAAAATGAYDARWITSLKKLASLRNGKSGTTFIRFAHEMNGNWYPWSVNVTNYVAFDAAWKRYRALQKTYFPEAKLVFNVNRESVGTGMDWRKFFPGAAYVDVLSVDYYNHYPYVGTTADWNGSVDSVDGYGAPKGLAQHLAFAKSVGLPLAVSEWANMSSTGDSAEFIKQMHDFFAANAGSGAGQLLYDIYFNVAQDDSNFLVYGATTKVTKAAAEYRNVF